MAVSSACVLVQDPRRIFWRVISANQRSTWLSHEALVGVKWRWKRWRRASQLWISAVLWVP